MKKGFTLVEMLIVVVILISLLTIVFRLSGVGESQEARTTTIIRMQKIENCLSGYYAAFGSYPPVQLHASQNPFEAVNDTTGSQTGNAINGSLADNWESVMTACRAQPFAANYPFDSKYKKYIELVSKEIVERASSDDPRFKAFHDRADILSGGFTTLENPNDVEGWKTMYYWQEVKIFRFGVMSFLLPRYLFMLKGIKENENDDNTLDNCKQWTGNNQLAANQDTGKRFTSWSEQFGSGGNTQNLLQRIPSQSVTARWLPNLEGIVRSQGDLTFYGITVKDKSVGPVNINNPYIEIYRTTKLRYVLDSATVQDGWDNDFYYYSEPPYQSYRLWSAGPNGKTFPPWYPLESIENAEDRKTAAEWMADDIMFSSN